MRYKAEGVRRKAKRDKGVRFQVPGGGFRVKIKVQGVRYKVQGGRRKARDRGTKAQRDRGTKAQSKKNRCKV